jgi:hypothetical protein
MGVVRVRGSGEEAPGFRLQAPGFRAEVGDVFYRNPEA